MERNTNKTNSCRGRRCRDDPQQVTGCYTNSIMTGINVEAVIMAHCKCQRIRSPSVDFPRRLCSHGIHLFKAGHEVANVPELSSAVISWLHRSESAHRPSVTAWWNFFHFFFFTKFHFAFWCVRVDRLSGDSCDQYCAVHSRPNSPISLSNAERGLIKELCRLQTVHRERFKVCTCSSPCFHF